MQVIRFIKTFVLIFLFTTCLRSENDYLAFSFLFQPKLIKQLTIPTLSVGMLYWFELSCKRKMVDLDQQQQVLIEDLRSLIASKYYILPQAFVSRHKAIITSLVLVRRKKKFIAALGFLSKCFKPIFFIILFTLILNHTIARDLSIAQELNDRSLQEQRRAGLEEVLQRLETLEGYSSGNHDVLRQIVAMQVLR